LNASIAAHRKTILISASRYALTVTRPIWQRANDSGKNIRGNGKKNNNAELLNNPRDAQRDFHFVSVGLGSGGIYTVSPGEKMGKDCLSTDETGTMSMV
jgi:hypothetical protein